MQQDDAANWLERLMGGSAEPSLITAWPDDCSMVFAADQMRVAAPGMAMRQIPCLRCERPVAGQPFQLWTLVGPNPCERNYNHLISVSALLHVTCVGLEPDQIADRIRDRAATCFDQ